MKVFVSNIPVRACVDGWVEIPDDTDVDGVQDAITVSLRDHGFKPHTLSMDTSEMEVDRSLVDEWEFTTPLEKT